jgi:hypothetical protein
MDSNKGDIKFPRNFSKGLKIIVEENIDVIKTLNLKTVLIPVPRAQIAGRGNSESLGSTPRIRYMTGFDP